MTTNELKAAMSLAKDAYPVVAVCKSSKGGALIHLGPMSVSSISSVALGLDDAEIEWMAIGAGGQPLPGSFYVIEGARLCGAVVRIVGTVAVSS